jgi:tagatose 1,6-diphosphate aldolase
MEFLEPGPLADRELEIVLAECRPANPLRRFAPAYVFELCVGGGRVGAVEFRVGRSMELERYGGHFGYSVDPPFRGNHYAERGVRALLPFARRHGFEMVWITCNPENLASRRTCERLGGRLVEIVALPTDSDQFLRGEREKCRYLIEV